MRLSGIAARLGLAALLFLAPMAYLLYALLTAHAADIDVALAELHGVDVLRALGLVLARVERATLTGAAGDLAGTPDQVMAAITPMPELRAQAERVAIALHAATNPKGIDAADAAVRSLITAVGDGSKLILDPQLDTYYVMDVVLGRLPDMQDRIADLTIAPRNTEPARIAFYVTLGGLKDSVDGFDASLGTAATGNPDGGVKLALGDVGELVSRDLHAFIHDVERAPGGAGHPDALLGSLARFNTLAQDELARLLKLRVHDLHRRQLIEIGASLGLFLLSVGGVMTLVIRGVIRPLAGLTAGMLRLAEGDLDVDVPQPRRRDEIAALATAMSTFKTNAIAARGADRLYRDERADAVRVQAAKGRYASEFCNSIVGMMARLGASSIHMQDAAVAVDEAAQRTLNRVNQAVDDASTSGHDLGCVTAAAEEMAASIAEIVRRVTQVSNVVGDTVAQAKVAGGKVSSLAETASRIGDVVRLISGIAGQTNLLALNATIEAARAGEAGRGFAVVASEVKALAAQTARATGEIGAQVAAIRDATEEAVGAVRDVAAAIGRIDGVAAAIGGAVEEQAAATRKITASVETLTGTTNHAAIAMTEVVEIAMSAEGQSQTVRAAAKEVADTSTTLWQEIDFFLGRMARTDPSDARRYERVDGRLTPVTFTVGSDSHSGRIRDISRGGIAMQTGWAGAPGQELLLQIDGLPPIRARAVRHDDDVMALAFHQDETTLMLVDRAMDHFTEAATRRAA